MGSGKPLIAFFDNNATYCGGLIQYQNVSATLGVSIQIDNIVAYLTVDHIFSPDEDPLSMSTSLTKEPDLDILGPSSNPSHNWAKPPEFQKHDDDSRVSTEHWEDEEDGLVDTSELWKDDDDEYNYEDEPESDNQYPTSSTILSASIQAESTHIETWEKLIPPVKLDPLCPYLDWSLVRPKPEYRRKCEPNVFLLDDLHSEPTVLRQIRDIPRGHLVRVKMVSAIRGVLLGRILYGSSFLGSPLGSPPGREDCEVLTVFLDNPEGLIEGECGSIVVDQETNEAYGHAVGCDSLGNPFVVPLGHVFNQVKASFGAMQVGLAPLSPNSKKIPDPISEPAFRSKPLDQAPAQRDFTGYRDVSATSRELQDKYRGPEFQQKEPATPEKTLSKQQVELAIQQKEPEISEKKLSKQQMELAMQQKELSQRQARLGPEHPDTVASMNKLALIFDNQGNYREAERMHRQILTILEKRLGGEHPTTLTSMFNLALALESQGINVEAERIHRQVLQHREKILGKEHPDSFASMNELALALYNLGKYGEAEQLHRHVLQQREKILGEEHTDTLTSMNNLALVLESQNKHTEAEELHLRTLRLGHPKLGDEHPKTLTTMSNLAVLLDSRGSHENAMQLNQEILVARKKVLGETHPDTLISMNNLAIALDNLGEYHQAARLLEDTVALRARVLGIHHPDTVESRNTLVAVLERLRGKEIGF